MQEDTHTRQTEQMEQEIEELRNEIQSKDAQISEHKEAQLALEQQMEEAKEAKSGQESSHALDKDKLTQELEKSAAQLEEEK